MSLPVYLVQPAGPERDENLQVLGAEAVALDDLDALAGRPPGLIVLDPRAGPVASLPPTGGRGPLQWRVALLSETGRGRVRWLSIGDEVALPELNASLANASEGAPAGLESVLAAIGRLRHDINNPLTAALVEVDLMRMDAEEGSELADSLEAIRRQLDRIRELAEATRKLGQ